MSITETPTAEEVKPVVPSKMWQRRIRKGQRLDQVLSTTTQDPQSSSSSSSKASTSKAPSSIDSPFQLQEYLALLVRSDPHDVQRIVSLPPESELTDDEPMHSPVDTDVWVYEQLRRLVLDLSHPWLTSMQRECDQHLHPATCKAMNAGDWMFLCASHGEEKQCCAIDYMIHTLDGAISLLNSARHFPSRTYVPSTSLRHFGAIARRLSRIFVHAWCYHKETFRACEAETSLYERFYTFIETYDLTSTDNLPPRDGKVEEDKVFERKQARIKEELLSPTIGIRKGKGPRNSQQPRIKHEEGLGLIPPPAPSPRPTAILQRPEHDDADSLWSTNTETDSNASLERSDSDVSTKTAIRVGEPETAVEEVKAEAEAEEKVPEEAKVDPAESEDKEAATTQTPSEEGKGKQKK